MADEELKNLFETLRQDVRQQIDSVRQQIESSVGQQVDSLGQRFDSLGQQVDSVGERVDSLGQQFDSLGQQFDSLGQQFDSLREQNEAAHEMTRRHFDVVAEANRHETKLVAEAVALTREALDREVTDIRGEVRRTASETQAMIKFSHAELDRRVQSLEEGVSDL